MTHIYAAIYVRRKQIFVIVFVVYFVKTTSDEGVTEQKYVTKSDTVDADLFFVKVIPFGGKGDNWVLCHWTD